MAAALLIGLAGCTGSSGDGDGNDSEQSAPSTGSSARPGKYRTLPEACGAVGRGTLRTLLPGMEDLEDEKREKAYDGQPALTYDTERRTGCRWTAELPEGTRHLVIDFERVVSYDPVLSDDDRAQQLYDRKATAAGIPAPSDQKPGDGTGEGAEDGKPGGGKPSASASESRAESADKAEGGSEESDADGKNQGDDSGNSGKSGESGKPEESGSGDGGEISDESGESPSADPATAPRALDELGDVAYIDDLLGTADSGVHRDITIVFRTSNVLVTITYDQWSTRRSEIPGSEELQSRAQRLARELSETFDA